MPSTIAPKGGKKLKTSKGNIELVVIEMDKKSKTK